MTDHVAPAVVPAFSTASPSPKPGPPQRTSIQARSADLDGFIAVAKKLVVDNYNQHRDTAKSPELPYDGVYVESCTRILGNRKVIVASTIIRGLLWEVVFNSYKKEFYLNAYKKINKVVIVQSETAGEKS